MTTPQERTRALIWAGGFLIELARDDALPLTIRRRATVIARHFPTIEELSAMAKERHPMGFGMSLAEPDEESAAFEKGRYGPLLNSTRLVWPEA